MISFNQCEFIEDALNSVISQDFQDWELVCIDPGSNDGSREIIENYSKTDNRIRFLFEPDLGPADGLNKALDLARGEVVGCLNSDDLYCPNAFTIVSKAFATNARLDCLIGHGFILRSGSIRVQTSDNFSVKKYFAGRSLVMQQSTFFKRDALTSSGIHFNVANKTCWDGEILLDCAIAKFNITKIDEFLGIFRIHGKSITGSSRNSMQYKADLVKMRTKIETNIFSISLQKFLNKPYAMYRRLRNMRYFITTREIRNLAKNSISKFIY